MTIKKHTWARAAILFTLLLISVSLSYAVSVTDQVSIKPDTGGSNTNYDGVQLGVKVDAIVESVGGAPGCTALWCGIWDVNGTLMSKSSLASNNCSFGNVTLRTYRQYYVAIGSGTSTYNNVYKSGLSGFYPDPHTNVNFTLRAQSTDGGGTWLTGDTLIANFVNITTTSLVQPADYLNISIPNPNNNTKHHNSNIIPINITVDSFSSFSGVNVSLYVDGVFNDSINISSGIAVLASFTKALTDGTHNYSINASIFNGDGTQNQSEKSGTYYIIVDTVSPTITKNPATNLNDDNSSIISSFLNNLTLNFTFTDNNIYQVLINVTNQTGSLFSYHNTSMTGTTLTYIKILDISNAALGNYTVTVQASDSHTSNIIKDYDVKKGLFGNYIEYKTAEGSNIKIESKESWLDISDFTTQKLTDRYTFSIKYNKIISQTSFRLTSDKPLVYLKDSKYNAHFVSGENWIDFEEFNLQGVVYSVTIIDDFTADISISNINAKALNFNSIGGLNINTKSYRFEIGSVLDLQLKDINTNASLAGNVTFNSTKYATSGSLRLNNISKGIYTATGESNDYLTGSSTANITSKYHNIITYLTPLDILDQCTYYTVHTLNFSFYNDTTDSLINTSFRYVFDYIYEGGIGFFSNEGTGEQVSLCMDITNRTIYTKLSMDYSAQGSTTKFNYYLANLTLTNATQTINLYIPSETSQVSLYVKDEYDDPIEDAYIYVNKYDVGDDNYRTMEILKTDEEGLAMARIVLNNEWYIFSVVYNNITYLTTSQAKIYETTKTFRITLGSVTDFVSEVVSGMNVSVVANKTSKTFTVSWGSLPSTVTSLEFDVFKHNVTNDALMLNYTNSASGGSYVYTLSAPYNESGLYTGNAYIFIGGSQYLVDSDSIDIREEFDIFGEEAPFMTFLFVGTLMLIGITVSAEISLILASFGMFIFFLLGFYQIALGALVGMIIALLVVMIRVRRR